MAGATALGLLFGSHTYLMYRAYSGNSVSLNEVMAPSMTDWYLWAALFLLILRLTRWYADSSQALGRTVAAHLLLGVVVATAKLSLDIVAVMVLPWIPNRAVTPAAVLSDLPSNFLTYGVAVLAIYAVDYRERARTRELRASQLEADLAQTQLQVLRMQLQPHLLFNALNAVTTLMHRNVEAAERMLVRLSELLRLTIEKVGVHSVSLREELEFLQSYLDIEKIRFPDRLSVTIDVESDLLDARVPHLILQPLVENAIRHGLEMQSTPTRIEITAVREGQRLEMRVLDDGPGLPDDWSPVDSSGMGLANVAERLRRLYGTNQELELSNQPGGGVLVIISIPSSQDTPSTSGDPTRAA